MGRFSSDHILRALINFDGWVWVAGGFLAGLAIVAIFMSPKRKRIGPDEWETVRKGAPWWVQWSVVVGLTVAGLVLIVLATPY